MGNGQRSSKSAGLVGMLKKALVVGILLSLLGGGAYFVMTDPQANKEFSNQSEAFGDYLSGLFAAIGAYHDKRNGRAEFVDKEDAQSAAIQEALVREQATNEQLRAAFKQMQSDFSQLRAMGSEQEARIQGLKANEQHYESIIAELEKSLKAASDKLKAPPPVSLAQAKEEMRKAEILHRKARAAQYEAKKMEADLESIINNRTASYTNRIERLERELSAAHNRQLAQGQDDKAMLTAHQTEIANIRRSYEAELSGLKSQLADIQDRFSIASVERNEMQSKLAQQDDAKVQAQIHLERVQALEGDLARSRLLTRTTEEELTSTRLRISGLEAKLSAAESKNANLAADSAELQRLRNQLAVMKEDLLTERRGAASTEDALQLLRSEMVDIKAQLAAAQAENQKRLASIKEARRVELEMAESWYVKAASEDVAFIKNRMSGKSLRVSRGFDVPGCGSVVSIDPKKQVVATLTCKITG